MRGTTPSTGPRTWWHTRVRHLPPRARRTGQLLARSVREYGEDRCPQAGAAIAYHVLFSLFPLALLGLAVRGIVLRDAGARDRVVEMLVDAVPLNAGGQAQLRATVTSISGPGVAFGPLGLLGLLWSATGLMSAVRGAVNTAWDSDRRRPFVRGKILTGHYARLSDTTIRSQ
jgi:membrane protein